MCHPFKRPCPLANASRRPSTAAGLAGYRELIPVTSSGDSDQTTPYGMGGIGVFCSEVQQVVLKGDVEPAHSLKDLPTAPPKA